MFFLYCMIMGIIQGLTEFLPVSSFGHLVVIKHLFGIDGNTSILFETLLHTGTAIAILLTFRTDVKYLSQEFSGICRDLYYNAKQYLYSRKTGDSPDYRRVIKNNYRKFAALIVVASIPTFLIGFQARRLAEMAGRSMLFPGIGLLISGILLLVVDFVGAGEKIPREVSYANAMWIGICQGMAVFPGLSRSGITISGCLLSGMNKNLAVKYSFLMSVPAIFGAMFLELGKFGNSGMTAGMGFSYIAGAIIAGVVGYFVIRIMLSLLRRTKLRFFAFYCFAAGFISLILHFAI